MANSSSCALGFGTGFIVSIFSRTLVLIGGLLAACYHVSASYAIHTSLLLIVSGVADDIQIASSYGLGLPRVINFHKFLTERIPVLNYGTRNPWFAASFVLTFILAAFVRL